MGVEMCHGDRGTHGGGECGHQEDMGTGHQDKGRYTEEVTGVEMCHGGHEEDMGMGHEATGTRRGTRRRSGGWRCVMEEMGGPGGGDHGHEEDLGMAHQDTGTRGGTQRRSWRWRCVMGTWGDMEVVKVTTRRTWGWAVRTKGGTWRRSRGWRCVMEDMRRTWALGMAHQDTGTRGGTRRRSWGWRRVVGTWGGGEGSHEAVEIWTWTQKVAHMVVATQGRAPWGWRCGAGGDS